MTGPWTQHCWHRTTRYIAAPASVVARTTASSNMLSIVLQPTSNGTSVMDWAVVTAAAQAQPLERLLVERHHRILSAATLDTFVHTWKSHQVGGAIVAWPVTERGRCGAQCGKVLFVLDQCMEAVLLDQQQQRRNGHSLYGAGAAAPLCCLQRVGNDSSTTAMPTPHEDRWGRNVAYSQGPPKGTEHHVVTAATSLTSNLSSTELWTLFQREHVPTTPSAVRRCLLKPRSTPVRGNLLQKIYRC